LNKILRDFDAKIKLPWAFAWGNHDCENFEPKKWFDRLDRIESQLQHLPHCVYKQSRNFIENYGADKIADNPREKAAYLDFIELYNSNPNPKNLTTNAKRFDGFYGGNYHIMVCNPKTGKPAWDLFVMNSRRDHHIPPKALHWMQDQINSHTPKLPTLMFFHVPPYEFEKYWNTPHAHGIKGEKVCHELDRGEIHQVLKSFGTVKGCFVGHDHVNDYYVDVDGIKYCYGRKTGNMAYGGDWSVKDVQYTYGIRKIKPGATLITIKLDNPSLLENSWDHCSVFSDGTTWKADKIEDMGTNKK
jgi:hypothetical protein